MLYIVFKLNEGCRSSIENTFPLNNHPRPTTRCCVLLIMCLMNPPLSALEGRKDQPLLHQPQGQLLSLQDLRRLLQPPQARLLFLGQQEAALMGM